MDAMKAHAKKICFVYAGEDHWGPLHQRDKLMDEIEGLEIVTDESYEHAFVLDDESSNKLALQCAGISSVSFIYSSRVYTHTVIHSHTKEFNRT